MAWVRNFWTTFSQTSACSPTCSRSAVSRTNPPVLSLALWQVVQYLLKTAADGVGTGAAEQIRAAEPAIRTASGLSTLSNATYLIYYTQSVKGAVNRVRLSSGFCVLAL